jgi:hypothetical protein
VGGAARDGPAIMLAPIAEAVGRDEPKRYNDVCHLSEAGKQVMLETLVETLARNRAAPGLPGGSEEGVDPRPAGRADDQDRADQ